ncbi:MAG: tetratricopeptide repeat protein [Opitutae bacterium]|nr:tetratricopeptide repeat protein [Opitutae bacterium]
MSSTQLTPLINAMPMSDAQPPAHRQSHPWAAQLAAILPAFAAGVLALATFAAYANSFSGPFVFDDIDAIAENLTLRQLWPPWGALQPPAGGLPVSGRPVVNFSFALNYAVGGTAVRGYHLANLLIHISASLLLFGIVRRTLRRVMATPTASQATATNRPTLLAFSVALLWALHPLQTASVTYLSQRAESLLGLFFLLTFYGFVRWTERDSATADAANRSDGSSTGWATLSATACLLGMATKEVMVSAPLLILLFDRTFVAGSWRAAWQQRRRYYLALAATWLLLAGLVATTGGRGGTAGFGTTVTWWNYALLQLRAIPHYVQLAFWPDPLIFYYGRQWICSGTELIVGGVVVGIGVGLTLYGIWRRTAAGFLGACFFAILAPSSSVVPVATELIAEHRMYLPLATLAVLLVVGGHALLVRTFASKGTLGATMGLVGCALLGVSLGLATIRRNADYLTPITLWSDTVRKTPFNADARNNLGLALLQQGDRSAALTQFSAALKLRPDFPEALGNLGNTLTQAGRAAEAIAPLQRALQLHANFPECHLSLGNALAKTRQPAAALGHYREALRLNPRLTEAHINLANVLAETGQPAAAIPHYRQALEQRPESVEAHFNLGNALDQLGRAAEAIACYEQALRLSPANTAILANLGNALLTAGSVPEAIARYEQALRLDASLALVHHNLGIALRKAGREPEAQRHFAIANQLRSSR